MRAGSPDEVLSGSAGYWPRVQSWLGGTILHADIPILGGRLTATTTAQVPERLTFTVPRWDGRDWLPADDPEHPLARFGQELDVTIVVWSAVTGAEYDTRIGRFRIHDWDYDDADGTVQVTAVGRAQIAADDRFVSPMAPQVGGTLASEFRRLLPAGMSVGIDPALVDRACPQSLDWAEDRLGALYEIADAWPALLRVDQWGQFALRAPLPEVPTPVLTLKDGERGTVVGVARADTRDQVFNRVVARSTLTDDPSSAPIQAVAEQITGPMRVDGPYGAVTRFISSPLIGNLGQAFNVARTTLQRSLLASRYLPVTHVPDPRVEIDDPVEVIRDGRRDWGYVIGYDLPLTINDGPARTDVGVPA